MKEKKKREKKTHTDSWLKTPLSLYYIWKTGSLFKFLKRFIDIPFVKTVRYIRF